MPEGFLLSGASRKPPVLAKGPNVAIAYPDPKKGHFMFFEFFGTDGSLQGQPDLTRISRS